MRHSSLYKVQNEDLNDKTKIRNSPGEEHDVNEEINANTLMLFYHPLFQETTKKFLTAIYQKQSNDIQIKFFQFIELNLRIQKALIETFQIEKAIVSALNDWNRELTLLNVQQHQIDQNGVKPFDLKYHYDSINELQMGASFSITNFAKLLENLKEHKSFYYSEYSISIEVFQKFLFDISCNWCQFYDIEIFCFFINAIFLQITKGQDFRFCQVKSLNQISYLPQIFFKEFNQVKYVYSRYIKKNLKTNFKMWCEWNFQRLNDICQSLVIKLGRIFAQDQRTEEYSIMFKDALDNFNKEIIQSASKNQFVESMQSMINQQQQSDYNDSYATYIKGGKKKFKFSKQQKLPTESQKIEENQMDEDEKGSIDNLDLFQPSKHFIEESSKKLDNSYSQSPDNKRYQISNGQICLNEIENKIIQKKLKQMNKILERQKDEIDEDSSSLKAAYRQAEKSNSNAFKYFQKLLRYKKEQQKKFIKNLPFGIINKSMVQQTQEQQASDVERINNFKQNQQIEVKNKQIIEDFYMCNQGKLNTNQKLQLQEELYQQGEYESNLKKESIANLYDENFSFYEGKQRFLHSQHKKKNEQKILLSQIQSTQFNQNQQNTNSSKQSSLNNSRNIVYSSQTPPIKNQSQREFSALAEKQNIKNEQNNIQTPHVLDLHQIALSKAHQISPSRQSEGIYDKNTPITPYRMSGYYTQNIQAQQNNQNNKKSIQNYSNSRKVSESQLNQSKLSSNSSIQNQSNLYTNLNNIETPKQNNELVLNQEVDKKQLTESKLYTTNSELEYSYTQQTRTSRIHSEQDYIFRNTSIDQKQPYNLFNKSLFNSTKTKKKISLGDIINLNYLYKPNLTFSGTQTNKSKQNEHHDLQIDIKSLMPEGKTNQNTVLTERRSQGQKVRSQTVGLGEILPHPGTSNINSDSKERQSDEKLNNSKIYLKPIQAQFTQKYRKLVSQSRYLWQKYLVEEDLLKINDYNKLNSFLDEMKNTKNIENIKQIILKYTQNVKQPIYMETSLYQFKIPYNRKADLPMMQGKNMKLSNKI